MKRPEDHLPPETLGRSSLQGNEYAWRPKDIPSVIDAARTSNLVNIGGQLQLRIPDIGTCECYWIEVDTYKVVEEKLPWPERVSATASAALAQYGELVRERDFLAEARAAFPSYVEAFENTGGDTTDALWFVWYVEAPPQAADPTPPPPRR